MTNVVISGANRGIGLALAEACAARGDTVVALCRSSSPELAALNVLVMDKVDVTDPACIQTLGARLNEHGINSIDLLINNAGVLARQVLGSIDEQAVDAIRHQFEVNAIGPLLLTQALIPLLAKGSRVGIVTSRMGSISDNTSGGAYGYRMSKAAVNIAGASLAVDLAPHDISVALLHPGYVRTEMTGGQGMIETAQAAAGMIAVLDKLNADNSGGFWHSNGERLPW